MAIINNTFSGKLNLDDQPFRIQGGDFVDALNITRDAQGEGEDIVVSNVKGNTAISYTLPYGTNKVIGKFADRLRNRIYVFIWNSDNHDLILYYNADTNTMVTLIENITDTGSVNVLNFNPSWKINHVDIIYREEQGDLLYWTDGLNPPRKINVDTIENNVYSVVKAEYITVAKAPPLSPPTGVYGSDGTRNTNALRRALFMFTSRFVYDDFEKSTFSTYSKIPLPVGYYGSDNDIDNTKNNFITVTVNTGDENIKFIEIAMRNNIGNAWSDFVLIASLDKDQLSIPNNTTYDFLFYNDTLYPPIDVLESTQLFDWVPRTAYTQSLPNGNVPCYGAITENYDNYPVSQLDVEVTAENQTNVPPDTDPPALTYTGGGPGGPFTFTVSGSVPTGTYYRVVAFIQSLGTAIVLAEYTSIGGDTNNSVATALYGSVSPSYATSLTPPSFSVLLGGTGGSSILSVLVTPGSAGGGDISTEKTWLWDCQYLFGIVYVDDQNRDMPGVTTFADPTNPDNDFMVVTPSFSLDGSDVQTPVISSSINHLPPAGAVKYYWVRRRLTYGSFLFYETCDYQDPGDGYLYFCLANIARYKEDNSQFIYGAPPITSESRIKIIAGVTAGGFNGDIYTEDYTILGDDTILTLTGGSSPGDDKPFIKVKKPTNPLPTAYSVNMLVMIYTPAVNPSTLADSVYWEWGEAYDIYEDNGVMYHRGMDQDQTASQPATFTWPEGDVYFHQRVMYSNILEAVDPPVEDTLNIMDANWSDFFDSAVNDNGRGQAISVNAQEVYNPVLIRHGLEYQSGTTVNNTNRFYFENQQEADRQYGDIRKMYIRDRYMRVYQKFKVGVIPILLQIIRDTSGNPLEANSDQLLNKINYPYAGAYGIGDVPESFAADNYSDYFVDNYRGVVCRLSQDGITALSILYDTNAFFVPKLRMYRKSLNNGIAASGQPYTGDPTVYGVFDAYSNRYIIAMEEINRYSNPTTLSFHQNANTISFLETRGPMEGFESPLSYHPENMVCLDTLLITCKDGILWTHDSSVYCNFYGTQYDAFITGVFNDNSLEKKTWQSMTQLANDAWECPEITTNVQAHGNTLQQSKLIPANIKKLEGNWHSSFLKATNTPGGWINGSQLKGNYIVIKFLKQNASQLIYLNGVSVKYSTSPLTNR